MQVIYHWAFAVAPALCPLHSQEWVGTCPSWIYGAGASGSEGKNARGVAKFSDFGPVEVYTLETVEVSL